MWFEEANKELLMREEELIKVGENVREKGENYVLEFALSGVPAEYYARICRIQFLKMTDVLSIFNNNVSEEGDEEAYHWIDILLFLDENYGEYKGIRLIMQLIKNTANDVNIPYSIFDDYFSQVKSDETNLELKRILEIKNSYLKKNNLAALNNNINENQNNKPYLVNEGRLEEHIDQLKSESQMLEESIYQIKEELASLEMEKNERIKELGQMSILAADNEKLTAENNKLNEKLQEAEKNTECMRMLTETLSEKENIEEQLGVKKKLFGRKVKKYSRRDIMLEIIKKKCEPNKIGLLREALDEGVPTEDVMTLIQTEGLDMGQFRECLQLITEKNKNKGKEEENR